MIVHKVQIGVLFHFDMVINAGTGISQFPAFIVHSGGIGCIGDDGQRLGDGFIISLIHFFSRSQSQNLLVFPAVLDPGLQSQLRAQGIAVGILMTEKSDDVMVFDLFNQAVPELVSTILHFSDSCRRLWQ